MKIPVVLEGSNKITDLKAWKNKTYNWSKFYIKYIGD